MNRLKKPLQILLVVLAAAQLTACSKTVQWEEEVPLNTGETIWVKRTDTFVKETGGGGRPLPLTWGLDKRAYEFSWQGQKYAYQVATKVGGPVLIHVFEDKKTIAIVDSAWPHCVGYGEFRWIDGKWQLQANVNKSLVGQPRNLMDFYSGTDGEIPARVTQEFIRNSHFDAPQNGGSMSHLLESKIAINCTRSK